MIFFVPFNLISWQADCLQLILPDFFQHADPDDNPAGNEKSGQAQG